MKNKLKLEHIAAYLPYGLKGRLYPTNDIHDVTGLFSDKFGLHEVQIDYGGMYALSRLKPILRPLSDLPESELVKKWNIEHQIYLKYEKRVLLNIEKAHTINIIGYPLGFITELYKEHYDIQGLIEQGLAIDINTLKK